MDGADAAGAELSELKHPPPSRIGAAVYKGYARKTPEPGSSGEEDMPTIRLTMAEAILRYLAAQHV